MPSYPPPPPPPPPHLPVAGRPAPAAYVWVAGLLDQVVLVSFLVTWLGLGLASTEAGAPQAVLVGCLFVAIFGTPGLVLLESWWASRRGSTVGHFVLGVRVDPSQRSGVLEVVEDYFFYFWPNLVLSPFTRLVGAGTTTVPPVRDPGYRTTAARCARAAVGVLVVVAPVGTALVALG